MSIIIINKDTEVVEQTDSDKYKYKLNEDINLYIDKDLIHFNEILECVTISLTHKEFEKVIHVCNEIKSKQKESKIR